VGCLTFAACVSWLWFSTFINCTEFMLFAFNCTIYFLKVENLSCYTYSHFSKADQLSQQNEVKCQNKISCMSCTFIAWLKFLFMWFFIFRCTVQDIYFPRRYKEKPITDSLHVLFLLLTLSISSFIYIYLSSFCL
jgi:hypothetical protein